MTELKAYDHVTDLTHEVQVSPKHEQNGLTWCGLRFTFPIFTNGGISRWVFRGTKDPATCLGCLAMAR